MSIVSIPADAAYTVALYLLDAECDVPAARGSAKHDQLKCLVAFWSAHRSLHALVGDARFKALALCAAPGEETRGGLYAEIASLTVRFRHEVNYLEAPGAWRRDRAVVLHAAKLNAGLLRSLDERFLDDKAVVLAAIRHENHESGNSHTAGRDLIYRRASERLRADVEVARLALEKLTWVPPGPAFLPAALSDSKALILEGMKTGCRLDVASERLRGDREVVLAAVSHPDASMHLNLQDASDALRDDRDVVEAAMRTAARTGGGGFQSIAFASERLRDDRDLALAAIRSHRYEVANDHLHEGWEELSPRLRADRSLFLEALAKSCEESSQDASFEPTSQYQYTRHFLRVAGVVELLDAAGPALQGDRDAVLACLAREPRALQCASAALCADRDLVLRAVSLGETLHWASEELQADREIVLAACAQSGWAIEHASEDFRDDREVMLTAVSQNGRTLGEASMAICADREVVLAAVRVTGSALEFADEELQDDLEIALVACENEGAALAYVSRRLRDHRAVRGAARAERRALIERAGGVDKLACPPSLCTYERTYEQRAREARARDFNMRDFF